MWFQKIQESYESVCSLMLQTKFSRNICGLSFLLSVLQVWNLWRYSHVLPIVVLHYVSFRYVCLFTKTPPLYMTHDGCGFLLFNLKSCLTFFVIHFILISYELLVNSWIFLMKLFESVSFLGEYRISAKTNGLVTSKKSGGIT